MAYLGPIPKKADDDVRLYSMSVPVSTVRQIENQRQEKEEFHRRTLRRVLENDDWCESSSDVCSQREALLKVVRDSICDEC